MTLDLAMVSWIWHKKAQVRNEKADKLDFLKILKICTSEDTINNNEDNPQTGKKYLQIIYLIKY